eukprot:CAMPEP_0178895220 /NCGR_PEP_ID=MMETSP0786-20121207/463_1 /TAXON_ID=186022 /ORGANISM="Thalassionema frauenfeldii, Strain CCMP 1798" /LENGTH=387 /DNA_ID=CAMNT_0020565421 /DNA_START=37 /DNA_END=1197 /DNA_ORIENTATION=+
MRSSRVGMALVSDVAGRMGGDTRSLSPTRASATTASQSNSLILPGKLNGGVSGSNNMNLGSMQLLVPRKPVTQDDFVDAVTNVMMGNVSVGNASVKDLSEVNEDESMFDDLSEIRTIESTLASRKEKNDIFAIEADPASMPQAVNSNNASLTPGKVFFYLDQQSKTVSGLDIPSTPEKALEKKLQDITVRPNDVMESAIPEEESKNFNDMRDESKNSLEHEVREVVAESVKIADEEGLFAKGTEMHERGDALMKEGKAEEAMEAFQEAQQFQKESIIKLTNKMSSMMHTQGLNHCDIGDKYLAVILLGVAEILKHRPTAHHTQLATQVHLGYKKVCPKQPEFRLPRKEMDKEISTRAQPMGSTIRAYAKAVKLAAKQRRQERRRSRK